MYFKVKLLKINCDPNDEQDGGFIEGAVQANSKEAITEEYLKSEGFLYARENLSDFEVQIEEVSVEELVREEENSFKQLLLKRYIERRYDYDTITVREYNKLCRQLNFESNINAYYEALLEERRIRYIKNLLRRKFDSNTITLKDYNDLARDLFNAKSEEAFDKICAEFSRK